MWIGLSDNTLKMFAKPKVLVPLKRRSKPAKKHKMRCVRLHEHIVIKAYLEWYKDAVF
jgi:hypothetical protein